MTIITCANINCLAAGVLPKNSLAVKGNVSFLLLGFIFSERALLPKALSKNRLLFY